MDNLARELRSWGELEVVMARSLEKTRADYIEQRLRVQVPAPPSLALCAPTVSPHCRPHPLALSCRPPRWPPRRSRARRRRTSGTAPCPLSSRVGPRHPRVFVSIPQCLRERVREVCSCICLKCAELFGLGFGGTLDYFRWIRARFLVSPTRPTRFCAPGQNPCTYIFGAHLRQMQEQTSNAEACGLR